MDPRYTPYRSFLMRIWQSEENRSASWRVFLVDPISGEQISFTNMEALTSYIQELIASETSPERKAHEGKKPQ